MNVRQKKLDTISPTKMVPILPQKFTMKQWHLENQSRFRTSKTQCERVESIIAESERVCEATCEATKTNKLATDRELQEKLDDTKFVKSELQHHRKNILLEIDALKTYKERITDALASLQNNATGISQKCLILRDRRLGIDLTVDDVEKELKKEYEVISKCDSIFSRALEHTNEQIRILKSLLYYIDSDLENKDKSIDLDKLNINLKETSLNLSIYQGISSLDPATITLQEWDLHNDQIIVTVMKQMNSTKVLRYYIDSILKEVVNDLNDQKDRTDEAFRRRIQQTKDAKAILEQQHSEVVKQSHAMTRNITNLEKNIAQKEGFLALAHTRLGNRCYRPNLELTRDQVQQQLVQEVCDIREAVAKLQQALFEAQATLRHLLTVQIQLEEDINIKTNTLKIDEVECMTIRQSLNFHAY